MLRAIFRKTRFGREVIIPFFRKLIHEIISQSMGTDIKFHQQWRAAQQTVDYIEKNLQNAREISSRYEMFRFALDNVSIEGLFLEFGVYMGDSINYIAKQTSKQIHGFDSFDGLPEYWEPGYDKGALAIKNKRKLKFINNVVLHVGYFKDTLPGFVEKNRDDVALLHIDADLYSSTCTVFSYLENQIKKGTIIIFDEYFNFSNWQIHEYKAFKEFCDKTQNKYEYIGYNRFCGQVAVKIL